MASIVKIKRSSVQGKAPTTGNLETGELALNLRDQKLFSSDGSSVFEVGANLISSSIGTLTVGNSSPFTLPTSDGSSGQYLTTDGSGTVSWGTVSSSGGEEAYAFELTNLTTTATNTNPTFSVAQGPLSTTEVYHNGLKLSSNDFTANSTTVTLNVAPSVGDVIEISVKGYASSKDVTAKTFNYTASEDQTVFTGSDDFGTELENGIASNLVFLNGILLIANVDYTVSNTSAIELASGAANNDTVSIYAFSPVNNYVDVNANITSNTKTSSTTSEIVVDSFLATSYRTAKYLVQMTDNANTEYQSSEVMLVHNGTTTYTTEYGAIQTADVLGAIGSDINSGRVRLKVTPTYANTTIKVVRTAVTV